MSEIDSEKKPCVICGEPCDIFGIQLGDFATLTHLRVCDFECLFDTAIGFLYSIQQHKSYRNKLHDLENKEDRYHRKEAMRSCLNAFLEDQRKNFEANPDILRAPIPDFAHTLFGNKPTIPVNGGQTMRFMRAKLADRIRWQEEHIESLRQKHRDAVIELEDMKCEEKP